MGDLPESIASGSNTFAPKIGSAGGYESDTLWSAGVATDFSVGIGKTLAENGIYYAEADTRRPAAILPPLARYARLRGMVLGTEDTHPLAGRCHFAEADDVLYMAQGNALYQWQEETQGWLYRLFVGIYVTSMVYFDGYLHIAGYREETNERDYLWIRADDFSYGADTASIQRPLLFHVFGGLLYAAQDNEIYYTAGSMADNSYPPPPWQWEWQGPIRVGGYGDPITGMAGLIYQQLGQRYVYVSTQSQLHVVLPGDVPFGITSWPMVDPRNGVGMRTFYNRIYIPIGGDLMALQANGDLIASGVDNNPEGLPYPVAGSHFDIATSASMPFVTIRSDHGYDTVWGGKASSWHFTGRLPADHHVAGSHYDSASGRLFVGTTEGTVLHWYLGNTNRPPQYDERYRYAAIGAIDTGWFSGALVEQAKYWHSVFADVTGVEDGVTVEVRYLTDNEDSHPADVPPYDEWSLVGAVDQATAELDLGYQVTSKRLRLVAILRSSDPTKTPSVKAIGLRYTPRLIDRNRWSITVKLPKWELYDANGAEVESYDQQEWDEHLKTLRKRETPVKFRDLDGDETWVLVTGASRRIHSVGVDDGRVTYDVDWSFALTEVAGA